MSDITLFCEELSSLFFKTAWAAAGRQPESRDLKSQTRTHSVCSRNMLKANLQTLYSLTVVIRMYLMVGYCYFYMPSLICSNHFTQIQIDQYEDPFQTIHCISLKSIRISECFRICKEFHQQITVAKGNRKVINKKMKVQMSNNGISCLIKTYLIDLEKLLHYPCFIFW